jgi:5'-3' exonuclease
MMYCKNFCKCHIVNPNTTIICFYTKPSPTRRKEEKKRKEKKRKEKKRKEKKERKKSIKTIIPLSSENKNNLYK